MSDKLDLGVNERDMYGDMGGPMPSFQSDEGSEKTRYPSFHYSGPEELKLPDEGEMTVSFKKTSETSRTRRDGSRWYECDIEVQCICDVEDDEPDEPTHRDTSAEDALDTLARKLQIDRGDDEGN